MARIALAVIGVLLLALVVAVIGFKMTGWSLQRERVATDAAVGAQLTVTGTRELTAAADQLAAATRNLRNATNAQDRATYADPAAGDVLPDSVRARIADDDQRLCASVACTGRPTPP